MIRQQKSDSVYKTYHSIIPNPDYQKYLTITTKPKIIGTVPALVKNKLFDWTKLTILSIQGSYIIWILDL